MKTKLKVLTASLPFLLTLGVGLSVSAAKHETESVAPVHALSGTTGDPSIDIGLHVQTNSTAAADWTLYDINANVNDATMVGNLAIGDYVAWRLKSAVNAGSYIEIMFNTTDGNCWRVDPSNYAYKKVDAATGAITDGATRTWHNCFQLDWNFDGWFLIDKSTITANQFGGGTAPDWNLNLWSVYYCVYATTIDTINFDFGDIYTANIVNGKMELVTHVVDWTKSTGTTVSNTSACSALDITRNNTNLIPAVELSRKLDSYNSCDKTSCESAYAALQSEYAALDAANQSYFETIKIYDYASGDTAHSGGKVTSYLAGYKWNAIVASATAGSSSRIISVINNEDQTMIIIVAVSIIAIIGGLVTFFLLRKKRLVK